MKIFYLLLCSFFTTSAFAMHVVLDPGHGGTDSGTTFSHLKESDINLAVAKQLEILLKKDSRFQVSLTRTSDTSTSLGERSKKAHQQEGDLFISLHVNSSPDKKVKGAEFYLENQLAPDEESMFLAHRENKMNDVDEKGMGRPSLFRSYPVEVATILDDMSRSQFLRKSYDLAQSIKNTWKKDFEHKKAKIRQAPFHVVSSVNMPSVLVEVGFLSNPTEADWLKQTTNQKSMAKTLYKAIVEYKERLESSAN